MVNGITKHTPGTQKLQGKEMTMLSHTRSLREPGGDKALRGWALPWDFKSPYPTPTKDAEHLAFPLACW